MSSKDRRDLLRELKSAIGQAEDALLRDPESAALIRRFRAFAASHEVDLSLANDTPPNAQEHEAKNRIPELLRILRDLEARHLPRQPHDATREQLTRELEQARRTLESLTKHDQLIKHGLGPYQDPKRRLKAQRALRELPTRIRALEKELEGTANEEPSA